MAIQGGGIFIILYKLNCLFSKIRFQDSSIIYLIEFNGMDDKDKVIVKKNEILASQNFYYLLNELYSIRWMCSNNDERPNSFLRGYINSRLLLPLLTLTILIIKNTSKQMLYINYCIPCIQSSSFILNIIHFFMFFFTTVDKIS